MILTGANIAYYLLERGLATPSSIVDGDLFVREFSRRNRVFRVQRGRHMGYFVKQVKDWSISGLATFDLEASFHSNLRTAVALAPLRRFVPRCYAYDAENRVLVFEIAAGETLHASDARSPVPNHAAILGSALRELQSVSPRASDAAAELAAFDEYQPWILDLAEGSGETLDDPAEKISPANAEMRRVMRRDATLCQTLQSLRQQWRVEMLIHGDMKGSNCLLLAGGTAQFLDWELAGWGDPLWDAAGIMQEYLCGWANRLWTAEAAAESLQAFWNAYGSGSESLERAFGYSAARMIQSAFEHQNRERRMTALSVQLLQAAANILRDPARAAALFFRSAGQS